MSLTDVVLVAVIVTCFLTVFIYGYICGSRHDTKEKERRG